MAQGYQVKGVVVGDRGEHSCFDVVLKDTEDGHVVRGWVNTFAGGHVDIVDGGAAQLSGGEDAVASAHLYAKAWAGRVPGRASGCRVDGLSRPWGHGDSPEAWQRVCATSLAACAASASTRPSASSNDIE